MNPHYEPTNGELYRRLAWRELALRFLDSCNPEPDRAIVIANCIVDYDGPMDLEKPLRHSAHEFFRMAERLIEHGNVPTEASAMASWIMRWNKELGV